MRIHSEFKSCSDSGRVLVQRPWRQKFVKPKVEAAREFAGKQFAGAVRSLHREGADRADRAAAAPAAPTLDEATTTTTPTQPPPASGAVSVSNVHLQEAASETTTPRCSGDGNAAAASPSSPSRPTSPTSPATPAMLALPAVPAVPWGDLPEQCVEQILLTAGFQSALSATAVCRGWRRVAGSNSFWRKMFVAHFGRKEAAAVGTQPHISPGASEPSFLYMSEAARHPVTRRAMSARPYAVESARIARRRRGDTPGVAYSTAAFPGAGSSWARSPAAGSLGFGTPGAGLGSPGLRSPELGSPVVGTPGAGWGSPGAGLGSPGAGSPGLGWDPNEDWRAAFKDAVCTEWRWVVGRCMRTKDWVGHSGRVVHVALHNGRAITAALDGTVRIWDAKSGDCAAVFRRRFDEHAQSPGHADADADNDVHTSAENLAAAAVDGSGGGGGGGGGGEVGGGDGAAAGGGGDEDVGGVVPVLCLAAEDGLAVAGSSDGTIAVYDIVAGTRLHSTLARRGDPVVCVAIGGGWVVAGLSTGGVEVRAARDGRHTGGASAAAGMLIAAHPPQHDDIVRCVDIDAAAGLAAAASGTDVAVWALALSPPPTHLAGGERERGACGFRPTQAQHPPAVWLRGHTEPVRSLCFARSCALHCPALVTGGDDATLRVWDAMTGRCLRELEGPPGTSEAEHAGQVPVGWTYRPPPGVTCVTVWAGQVVEGRDDGSVLVWTGVFEAGEAGSGRKGGVAGGGVNTRVAKVVEGLLSRLSGDGGRRRAARARRSRSAGAITPPLLTST